MRRALFSNSKRSQARVVATVMPLFLGIILLSIYSSASGETQQSCRQSLMMNLDEDSRNNPIVVSIKQLERVPEQYYGKTVTVAGELHRDFTDNIFTIKGSGVRDKDILVVSTVSRAETVVPLENSLQEGKEVRITGVIQPYDRGRLECAYGPLQVESREGHSFTKNPVLIIDKTQATSVVIASQSQSDCRQNLLMHREESSINNPIAVSMKELQRNPDQYYGKTVTVDGELHRDFADNVFTIAGSGFFRDKDILIISTASKAETVEALENSLKEGKNVRVTGLVHPYDRGQLECAYGPLHLESREGHSFTKNPVLIVDRVQPVNTALRDPVETPAPIPTAPAKVEPAARER